MTAVNQLHHHHHILLTNVVQSVVKHMIVNQNNIIKTILYKQRMSRVANFAILLSKNVAKESIGTAPVRHYYRDSYKGVTSPRHRLISNQ